MSQAAAVPVCVVCRLSPTETNGPMNGRRIRNFVCAFLGSVVHVLDLPAGVGSWVPCLPSLR